MYPILTPDMDLAPGTLVRVAPSDRWEHCPFRTAVVVDTEHAGSLVFLWFWGLGAPHYARSAFTVYAREVRPVAATLATLPAVNYRALADAYIAAVASDETAARFLAPLARPLASAAH